MSLLPPLPPSFSAALRDVGATRPESRMAAAERLGRAEGSEREPALEGLARLVVDAHAGVRATAHAALGLLGEEGQIELVLAGLDDGFAEVREFAALAAAQIGGERAREALRAALTHPAPEVRFQAVAGVAELAPERAAQDLVPLLVDPDAEVRGQTVCALASLEEPRLAGHFAAALDDRTEPVRLEAALALAGLGDARGEAVLLEALARRERVVEIADALAAIGSTRAREPLAGLALRLFTAPHVRAGIGAALHKLGDPRGAQALRRVLGGLRADARGYAVELARDLEIGELVEDLVRLASRPRGADLLTVVDALARFEGAHPAARAALDQLARRDDETGAAARQVRSQHKG